MKIPQITGSPVKILQDPFRIRFRTDAKIIFHHAVPYLRQIFSIKIFPEHHFLHFMAENDMQAVRHFIRPGTDRSRGNMIGFPDELRK